MCHIFLYEVVRGANCRVMSYAVQLNCSGCTSAPRTREFSTNHRRRHKRGNCNILSVQYQYWQTARLCPEHMSSCGPKMAKPSFSFTSTHFFQRELVTTSGGGFPFILNFVEFCLFGLLPFGLGHCCVMCGEKAIGTNCQPIYRKITKFINTNIYLMVFRIGF